LPARADGFAPAGRPLPPSPRAVGVGGGGAPLHRSLGRRRDPPAAPGRGPRSGPAGRRLGRGGGRLPPGGGGVLALPARFWGRRWGPRAREALLVAVEGGGSRTRLWLLDPEGRLLGRGEGGTSNPTAAGVGAAVR